MGSKRIVISGGPSTGKTAIIDHLISEGYHCFEEVIRRLTLEAQESGEIKDAHSNPIALVDDSEAFNKRLLQLRIDDFNKAKQDLNFYDRGTLDVLAYMKYFDQNIPEEFSELCHLHSYDQIFILPPWKDIYHSDNERFETYDQAEDIYHHLKSTYLEFGYEVYEIPFGTIEQRTEYLLKQIMQ